MRIAVIVTTYNRPDALAAVLEGYLAQTDRDFEVLVADDGSTPDTAQVVQQFQARATFPIHHVWQEDDGFRAAAIRNRALAATTADYIIFTDGDCIPPADFVAQQRKLSEQGCFLSGNRLLLSRDFTQQVLAKRYLFISGISAIGCARTAKATSRACCLCCVCRTSPGCASFHRAAGKAPRPATSPLSAPTCCA